MARLLLPHAYLPTSSILRTASKCIGHSTTAIIAAIDMPRAAQYYAQVQLRASLA